MRWSTPGYPASSRSEAKQRGKVLQLRNQAVVATDSVSWVARYRSPKNELDAAAQNCVAAASSFSYGPINANVSGTRCTSGAYTNPCALECFRGGEQPRIDIEGCRERFCKRGQHITRNLVLTSSGAPFLSQTTTGQKFNVIITLNGDRDRYRRTLGFLNRIGDDPDAAILEQEATNKKVQLEKELDSARRDLLAAKCTE